MDMDAATRRLVRERAENRCEYCGLHQDQSPSAALHIEHVVPKKHGGSDGQDNLALARIDCNLRKGTNLAGYDPESGALTELFHPRLHAWPDHFARRGTAIVGVSAIGRTTVAVLDLNSDEQLQLRAEGARS
jgi:hypothetical protein